jgi:hypothetical protein
MGTAGRILLGAFVALVAANLIHNNFGLDPAVAPAALLVALNWWRPNRWLLRVAAVLIALPAFAFLKLGALANPGSAQPFWNHVALAMAGALAVLALLKSLAEPSTARQRA